MINVTGINMTRATDNNIVCSTSGAYDYDTACTFVKIETQSSWPAAGGGVTKGPLTKFAVDLPKTQEKDVLPARPTYFASVAIPDLAAGTVVTATSEIYVTKPNPAGGVFNITKNGTATGKAPPRNKTED